MKALQIWEYPPNQPNLQAMIDYAAETGFDTLLAKGLEGTSWHGEYTPGSDYIRAAEDIAEFTEQCHRSGVQYHTWCVPRPNVNMEIQAQMMSELAIGSDGLWIDAEPYPAFWGANQPEEKVRLLMGRVRELAPDQLLVLQPDPRPARFAELRGDVWMEYCNVMSGQHYWSDFWPPSDPGDALRELNQAAEYQEYFNKPVWPTCPTNCPTSNLTQEVLDILAGFAGFAVFRAGSGPYENFVAYGSVPATDTIPPDPAPPAPPELSEIDILRRDNEFYRTVLGSIRQEVVNGLRSEFGRKGGIRRGQIIAIADNLDKLIEGALGS